MNYSQEHYGEKHYCNKYDCRQPSKLERHQFCSSFYQRMRPNLTGEYQLEFVALTAKQIAEQQHRSIGGYHYPTVLGPVEFRYRKIIGRNLCLIGRFLDQFRIILSQCRDITSTL